MILVTLGLASLAQASPCNPVPPEGYVVAVGWARGSEADALAGAQDMARNRLVGQICDGRDDLRCASLRPHVRDWTSEWDPSRRTACAQAAVEATLVDTVAGNARQLDADLVTLARALALAAGDRPVRLNTPATTEGRAVRVALEAALATVGSTRLAGASGAGAVDLDLQFAPTAEGARVSAVLRDGLVAQPLPGLLVPKGFLVESDLPLVLQLTVEAERTGGVLLRDGDVVHAGDTFTLAVVVSASSFVYVVYENSAGEEAVLDDRGTWVEAGRQTQLPRPGFQFRVDTNAGRTEVVHVLASPRPLPESELGSGVAAGFRQVRGLDVVASTQPGEAPPEWVSDPVATVTGFGGAAYTLILDHQ